MDTGADKGTDAGHGYGWTLILGMGMDKDRQNIVLKCVGVRGIRSSPSGKKNSIIAIILT
jgi:hypothetical protein